MGSFQIRSSLAFALVAAMLLLIACEAAVSVSPSHSTLQQQHQIHNLLNNGGVGGVGYSTAKRVASDECSEDNVVVYQNNAPQLSSGIPAYSVEIINVCGSCTVYDVHVSCRDFASTDLVNPAIFRRLGFDDCLVKDGGAMEAGETASFQYSNSFAYPLDIASLACN